MEKHVSRTFAGVLPPILRPTSSYSLQQSTTPLPTMSLYSLDPSRRRRRRRPPNNHRHHPASPFGTAASLATTAAVAYGVYRVGVWAWNSYFGQDDDGQDEGQLLQVSADGVRQVNINNNKSSDGTEGDILYEWCDDYTNTSTNGGIIQEFDNSKGIQDVGNSGRSRRSRVDWGEANHGQRSHRPSPQQDYHHHHDHHEQSTNGEANSNGLLQNGMKKAASLASTGVNLAASSAITAGMSAAFSINNSMHTTSKFQQTSQQQAFLRNARMNRCRMEACRAMMDFLPTLKKAIVKETDVGRVTEELKRCRARRREIANSENGSEGEDEEEVIRERERELWDEIKRKSVTRLVTTAYVHNLVFLVLTVQVNLLGGRLLREEQQEMIDGADESLGTEEGYRASHQIVLARTYNHVFAKGIPALAEEVSKVVEDVVQDWDVLGSIDDDGSQAHKDCASLDEVSFWIERIRDCTEKRQQKVPCSPLVQFVIPDEDNETMDELAKHILDETYDLLESPTFARAERTCLDATFAQLRDEGYAKLFSSPTINDPPTNGIETKESKPLANVITHLQKAAVATFFKPPSKKDEIESWGGVLGMMEEPLPSAPNVYLPMLEQLHSVLELGAVCFD